MPHNKRLGELRGGPRLIHDDEADNLLYMSFRLHSRKREAVILINSGGLIWVRLFSLG